MGPSIYNSLKLYRCFIGYRPNSIGVAGIERYAFECANVRRPVGYYSHIAAKYLSKKH